MGVQRIKAKGPKNGKLIEQREKPKLAIVVYDIDFQYSRESELLLQTYLCQLVVSRTGVC